MLRQQKCAFSIAAISALATVLTIVAPASAAQKQASLKPLKAGRVAGALVNTILSGTQSPKGDDGIDGDFYIDTKLLNFFGPKTKGRWSAGVSLRGAPGAPGSDGKNGSDGKSVSNISANGLQGSAGPMGPRGDIGPQGVPGLQGVKGETGSKGESGAKGDTGAAGLSGATGPQGAPGAQGLAGTNGTQGLQGAQGIPGANGTQGVQGVAGSAGTAGAGGSAGAQGVTGPAGPSKVMHGNIVFASNIQGSVGSSQASNAFGGFQAGKSYLLKIRVKTYNTTNNLSTYPLSFAIAAQGAVPTLYESYSVVAGSNWISGAKQDEVNILSDIAINGSSTTSDYTFIVTIACGSATGVFPISLSGNYIISEVNQVSVTS